MLVIKKTHITHVHTHTHKTLMDEREKEEMKRWEKKCATVLLVTISSLH